MKTKLVEISYFEGKIKYYKVEINRTIKYVLDKYNYSINNKWIYKEFELHTDLNIQFNYDDLIIISDHEITKEDVVLTVPQELDETTTYLK